MGSLKKIASTIGSDSVDDVIDAQNNFVSSGLVDVHVHYRQPGQKQKETIKTGSMAAAHGGFTTVGAMPNLTPAPDSPENLNNVIKLNQKDGVVHIKQYATITTNRGGDELVDFPALKKKPGPLPLVTTVTAFKRAVRCTNPCNRQLNWTWRLLNMFKMMPLHMAVS